jgi:acetolactate synthase-1/2/3 large subunit
MPGECDRRAALAHLQAHGRRPRSSAWAASSSCPSTKPAGGSGLRHILINDERCGAFAADAYARVTNRPGVCDAYPRPRRDQPGDGARRALNAGVPLVAIVGDAHRDHAEEHDPGGAPGEVLRPRAKEVIRVESVRRIPSSCGAPSRSRPRAARPGGPRRAGGRGPRRALTSTPRDLGRPGTLAVPARAPPDGRRAGAPALSSAGRAAALLVGGGIHLSKPTSAASLAEARTFR